MPKFELKEAILLLAIGQGVFLALVLFLLKRGSTLANRLLSILILTLSFYLFTIFVFWTGLIRSWPHFIMTGTLVLPLIPPLFYLYLRALMGYKVSRGAYLHFLPFLVQAVYWAPFYFSSVPFKVALVTGQIEPAMYSKLIGNFFEYAQFSQHAIYVAVIWIGTGVRYHSNLDGITRNWLTWVKRYFTFYAFVFVVGDLSYKLFDFGLPDYVYFYSIALFLYLVGYYGYYQQHVVFTGLQVIKPKYSYSTLTSEDSTELFAKLVAIMEGEKPYLNYNLKLKDMADRLQLSVHHLSRVVNENSGHNFSDFINAYRVKEARKILEDPDKMDQKMLAVAFDSGFGNKVSFYKSFKKFEGSSPVEYRGRIQGQKAVS